VRRVEDGVEHLDRRIPVAERDATLADMDRLSAWFGGHAIALRALASLIPPSGRTVVLDVGGGRGDFARRLIAYAGHRGRRVHVVVVDRDAAVLDVARRGAPPNLSVVLADATALPFREAGADVVTMSLTLHHLPPEAAVATLREMRATARTAVIVNDLLRTRLSLVLVWLATRLLRCHPVTRHDGPLSVRRAYSPDELRRLAGRAGLPAPRITRYPALGRLLAIIPA
jgi:SAM-dependent methyltransferase